MGPSVCCRAILALALLNLALLQSSTLAGTDSSMKERRLLGEWMAVSKVYMVTLGDMRVLPARLQFTQAGSINFEVIQSGAGEYVLRLGKEVAGGRYMRLGPIRKAAYVPDSLEVEVAFFKSEAKALLPEKVRADHVTSWGIYAKE